MGATTDPELPDVAELRGDEPAAIAIPPIPVAAVGPVETRPQPPLAGAARNRQLTNANGIAAGIVQLLNQDWLRSRAVVTAVGGMVILAFTRAECESGIGYLLDDGDTLELFHRDAVFARAFDTPVTVAWLTERWTS